MIDVPNAYRSLPKVYHQKLYSSVIDIICQVCSCYPKKKKKTSCSHTQVNLDDLPFSLLPDCTWAEDCYTGTLLSRALVHFLSFIIARSIPRRLLANNHRRCCSNFFIMGNCLLSLLLCWPLSKLSYEHKHLSFVFGKAEVPELFC